MPPSLGLGLGLSRSAFFGGLDADAAAYIAAVEAADGQALEPSVKAAYDTFIRGCKLDTFDIVDGNVVAGNTFRNYDRIKASCILAGARTLSGAFVPLKGAAPTNFNFVSADYNRKTGLVGNGSTKYLDSNRNNNVDPQNSKHIAVYATTLSTEEAVRAYIGASFVLPTSYGAQLISGASASKLTTRLNDATTVTTVGNLHAASGFIAASRTASGSYIARGSGISETISVSSNAPTSGNIFVHARNLDGSPNLHANARLAFYSIGEALDLAKLETRVSRFMAEMPFAINTGLDPSSFDIDTLSYINAGYAAGGTLA